MKTSTLRIAHPDRKRREPLKVNFSRRLLDSIRPPTAGRTWVYDATQPGLCLMITASDARTFYLYKWVSGRPQRVRLGTLAEVTVDQARKMAAKLLGKIAEGGNPMAEKRAIRAETTVGELWSWHSEQAKLRNRSFKTDEGRWKVHLAHWSSRRLSDLGTPEIAAWHARTGKTQPRTANRALALLSVMFNNAKALGYTGANPCEGVRRFPEQPRERFLNADELGRLAAALEAEPEVYRDLFRLCLWTRQRQGNVRAMAWAELDLKAGRWSIPGAKFKNGKPQVFSLSAEALDILKRRRLQAAGDAVWVFPQDGNPTEHIGNPQKSWARVRKAANLPDVRIHDLRRTGASWMVATGASLPVVGKALGHRAVASTAIYARLELDPVREAVAKSNAAMQAAMQAAMRKGKPTPPRPTA